MFSCFFTLNTFSSSPHVFFLTNILLLPNSFFLFPLPLVEMTFFVRPTKQRSCGIVRLSDTNIFLSRPGQCSIFCHHNCHHYHHNFCQYCLITIFIISLLGFFLPLIRIFIDNQNNQHHSSLVRSGLGLVLGRGK